MKLVIEIDKRAFDYIMACSFVEDEAVVLNQSLEDRIKTLMFFDVLNAIKSGTPLPKGHGDLKDADIYKAEVYKYIAENKNSDDLYLAGCGDGAYHALHIYDCIPTIIESDKGTDKSEV